MTTAESDPDVVVARLHELAAGNEPVALALAAGVGLGLATARGELAVAVRDPWRVVAAIDATLAPRWVWWSIDTAAMLVSHGVRVSRCWDVAAAHRLLAGGWKADPQRVWAYLHDLSSDSVPTMGQLDLLGDGGDEGTDFENVVRPDGHLRPEWAQGGWASSVSRLTRWAATALTAGTLQQQRLATLVGPVSASIVHSESAAELLCAELAADGLPLDVACAEAIIATFIGPRSRDAAHAIEMRNERDGLVLAHAPLGGGRDLRNPAHVRSMLHRLGVDVTDTRAWRLEPFRSEQPFVDELLRWRKAERVETTFGYAWLDRHVGADGRLRGAWTGADGAAGRMTAQAGLHNLPAEMRDAVAAEGGYVFVHADLGQVEPRVLAAVSGDESLVAATQSDDLYAPVAATLGVERSVAKVAVLAAMYGQTSGTAGQALAGLEAAYPTAMRYLRDADAAGRAGNDLRTAGGRLIRMWPIGDGADPAALAARGRYSRNAVVQGAAAELFKVWVATIRARSRELGARIVLCLHDEVLVHVPEVHGRAAADIVENSLAEAADRWQRGGRVRFVAQASVISRWSDARK